MFSSISTKINVCLLTIILVMSSMIYIQHKDNKYLNNQLLIVVENHKWQTIILRDEIDKAKITIETLNNNIKEFAINKENYELEINEKEKELLINKIKKQEDIKKELEIDNSSDNQLKLITVILEDFSE